MRKPPHHLGTALLSGPKRDVVKAMVAFLAALVTFSGASSVPFETQSIDALRNAKKVLRKGDFGRGLATLDSLLFRDGVSVALEAPNDLDASVERGLEVWNEQLGEKTFHFVPAGESADVRVKFVRSLDAEGADVQGMVEASRELSWSDRDRSYKLRATIFVRDNIDGRPLRADETVSVVAHEVGHLLGLADVSSRDRLMGPLVIGYPHAGPTRDESAAVRSFRSSIRDSYPKRVDKR